MTMAERPPRPLVIELCGLPGAGKTTIASQLVTGLMKRGITARVVDRHVSADASCAARLTRKTATLVRVVTSDPRGEFAAARLLSSGQPSRRDKVALPVQWWVAKEVLARSRQLSGVAVAEEGLVQALWSAGLAMRTASATELVRLARTAVTADVVAHVDVPLHVAVDRLRNRRSRHSRVQRMEGQQQVAVLEAGNSLLHRLLEQWVSRDLSQVLLVDGRRPDAGERLACEIASPGRLGRSVQ